MKKAAQFVFLLGCIFVARDVVPHTLTVRVEGNPPIEGTLQLLRKDGGYEHVAAAGLRENVSLALSKTGSYHLLWVVPGRDALEVGAFEYADDKNHAITVQYHNNGLRVVQYGGLKEIVKREDEAGMPPVGLSVATLRHQSLSDPELNPSLM
jgi:hypothetical protein